MMTLSVSPAGSYQFCQNIRYGTWYAAWSRRHRSDDDPQHVANRLVPVLPEHPLRQLVCSAESAASSRRRSSACRQPARTSSTRTSATARGMQRGLSGIGPMMTLSMSPTGSYQFYQNIRYGMWHAARGGSIVLSMILSRSPPGLDRLWVTARPPRALARHGAEARPRSEASWAGQWRCGEAHGSHASGASDEGRVAGAVASASGALRCERRRRGRQRPKWRRRPGELLP